MEKMFAGCKSLQSLNITHFDTSSVTSMAYLFSECSSLIEINLTNLNTSLVNNMNYMFHGDSNLTNLGMSNFDTSNVKSMEYMFSGCKSLKDINVTNFDLSSLKRTGYMFANCPLLTSLDLSNFGNNVIDNMDYMFTKSENLVYINFGNLMDSNIKSMYNIFSGTPENMVICINETNAPNMRNQIINIKGCSMINCSDNWSDSRKKVKAINNVCVKDCDVGYKYLYEYKCYERCPKDTYSKDYICRKNITSEEGCDTKSFFLGKCTKTFNTSEDKRRFIEEITKEILNLTLYELLIEAVIDKKIHTKKLKDEIYQIYSLSNKKRIDGITYLDFDNCAKILKERHNLGKDEDLIMFKIEYKYPGLKIPIIEYQIFNKNGMRKLNLYHCKNVKIMYYIPKEINNYKDYKYNPNHPYYSEKCLNIDTDFPTDLVLYDRKNEFNKNSMSLCESICTFKGYINNNIICECEVKLKFNSFLNDNSDKYNVVYRFDVKETNENNFWTVNCFLNRKIKFSLLFNECSIFNIIIFILIIVGAVLFILKEFNLLQKRIKNFIQLFLMIKKEKGELGDGEIGNSYIIELEEEEISENSKDKKGMKISFNTNTINKNMETMNEENKIDENSINNNENNYKAKNTSGEILKIKSHKILKANNNKKSIKKLKKYNFPKKIKVQELNDISQNSSSLNSKIPFENKKVIFNDSKNINKIIENKNRKSEYLMKSDFDLNNLGYKDAKLLDKRTFMQYYVSLIKTKHIIFFVFKPKYQFHSRIIHYCFLLFLIPFYLAFNTFFVDSATIHNIYISKGSFDLSYNLPKIIGATIILYILQTIFYYFISTDDDVLEIKSIEEKKFIDIINEKIRIITLKCILFFATSLILLNLCGFYIGCFAAIFPKTIIHLFIRLILSFIFSLIIPLVLYFLPAAFRFYALKGFTKQSEDLYRISQYLQIL